MAEGRELHEMIETGKRWVEHVRHRSEQGPATASPPYRTKSGTDVEQRRRVIVALLHQHQNGLTAREIREATGLSKNLTDSALSGLFIRGVVHKHGHRYLLAAQDDAREH
jgi:predicted HTH transcriptional regulator